MPIMFSVKFTFIGGGGYPYLNNANIQHSTPECHGADNHWGGGGGGGTWPGPARGGVPISHNGELDATITARIPLGQTLRVNMGNKTPRSRQWGGGTLTRNFYF